jgi:hypothetical protein
MNNMEARQAAVELLCEHAQQFSGQGELLRQVVGRFVPLIHDLPATRSGHHSWKFGLLDHSLEVALTLLHALPKVAHRDSGLAPFVAPALAVALLHHLGLLSEVTVTWQGRTWKPFLEDLASFTRLGELLPWKRPSLHWRRRSPWGPKSDPTRFQLSLIPREWCSAALTLIARHENLRGNILRRNLGPLDYPVGPIFPACPHSAQMARMGKGPGFFLRHLLAPIGSEGTSSEEILAGSLHQPA